MYKLILFKKYSPLSHCWKNLVRKIQTDTSLDEIINKYNGFEGELLSITNFNLNQDVNRLNIQDDHHLLIVCSNENVFMNDKFKFMGFDVGICESDHTLFSSIFNEILFGCVNDLISFSNKLNANYLFDTESDALKYLKLHHDLFNSGFDVEHDSNMLIYKVYSPTASRYGQNNKRDT